MKYFVTIYIHPMDFNIPHAFLGLTKDKSPDELDTIDKVLRDEKLKNADWNDINKKWYESLETNEYNDGFFGFAPVKSDVSHWGKVYENNQYVPKWNENIKNYDYTLRDKSTFDKSNRCTLEVSQEQYEKLLESIKQDVTLTKDRNGDWTKNDISLYGERKDLEYQLYYNSTPITKTKISFVTPPLHNCTTWALNKLESIGIEVYNAKEWIPDAPVGFNLKNTLFTTIQAIHSTFLKFQNIDDNLKSIKGAIAFKDWARKYINHSCLSQVYLEQYNKERGKDSLFLDKEIMQSIFHLGFVYLTLDKILQSRLDKIKDKHIKGDFELIYYEQQEQQLKILKASNDYQAEPIKEFDLSVPANNCSLNKFYPFIFIPKDVMISRILYHQYDYGEVSNSYEIAMNRFYKNVIAGIQSDKYWSKSYHKMNKNLEKLNA